MYYTDTWHENWLNKRDNANFIMQILHIISNISKQGGYRPKLHVGKHHYKKVKSSQTFPFIVELLSTQL